ncbi:GGDEF domain-containing protein [Pokkaliibacter sp. MBI-7]|uniref:GGDEF domain-containing protein n=1 Tax=Pokkaliibacter sp. MBI-7 TaxID=3040600 RepID=UPI0024479A21|nr:GGDEF domain-containing protein [Pokkaliibacter sp. MBI-7]MDH2432424.1 GGDEF domain-containing protein [Pokkaliibacter sp. MBI-7]
MNWLDLPTLIAVNVFASLVFMGIFFSLWRYHPEESSFIWPFCSGLSLFTGICMFLLRPWLHDLISILVGNIGILYGHIFILTAVRSLYRQRLYGVYWLVPLPLLLALLVFTFVIPSMSYRVIAFCLSAIVVSALLLADLRLAYRQGHRLGSMTLLVAALTDLLVQSGRIILTLAYPLDGQLFDANPGSLLALINGLSYLVLCPLGFMMLYNERLQGQLKQEATHDHLTGLLNLRAFLTEAEQLLQSPRRQAITLALIDLDWFKKINDNYGHQAGDHVLEYFAQLLSMTLHGSDACIGRVGGEEFAVLWHNDSEQAREGLERLRQHLQHQPPYWERQAIALTFSCGMVSLGPECSTFDSLYREADRQLYQAKENGRNCLSMA